MSRPYINIASATYSANVLTTRIQSLRTRGGGVATLSGFTSSVTFNILGNTQDGFETFTFSSSAIGGTPSGNRNLLINFPELGYNTGIYPPNVGKPFSF